MSFTNGDLSFYASRADRKNYPRRTVHSMTVNAFNALLARLKASEALHEFRQHKFLCNLRAGEDNCTCGLEKAWETYCQSIGKTKGE